MNYYDKKTSSKKINDDVFNKIQISSHERILINSLEKFYLETRMKNMEQMLPIINSNSNISLRSLDHFVTNYSRKHRITYNIELGNNKYSLFRVNASYKDQLKAYNKKYFDPFCRGNRIPWFYGKNGENCIITTIGQLNFFKWTISNNILTYVSENLIKIENDMNKNFKNENKKIKNLINNITITNNKTGKVNKHTIKIKNKIDNNSKMLKIINGKKPKVKIMVTFE